MIRGGSSLYDREEIEGAISPFLALFLLLTFRYNGTNKRQYYICKKRRYSDAENVSSKSG